MTPPLYKSHPWHGISAGPDLPKVVTAFIEIVPTDTLKYEIDKVSGFMKVDRPQKFSNVVPALYGFIPQTYSGKTVAKYATDKANRLGTTGDGDPLDILVLTERVITTGGIILSARPIGGFRLFDKNEVDDKIIAVMLGDAIYESYNDISELPKAVVERLKHYFLTYKNIPENDSSDVSNVRKTVCEITDIYGKFEAEEVINRSLVDYQNEILRS